MTPWQEFYGTIKDESWPNCDREEDFSSLPSWIKKECQEKHGYIPGSYQHADPLPHKTFPIKTATACQLKWNWSTIFLTTQTTASCHRTNSHKFDTETFNFHNTPNKLQDRDRMLQGQWPEKGCEYCRNIEAAGGQSDRITNLDMPGMHAPPELDSDPNSIDVTPRILEVYFDNTCNLKCVYCGPYFSSLWDAENKKYGRFEKDGLLITADFQKSKNIEQNKTKLFEWIKQHSNTLTNLNILGGEPLYQDEFDQTLEMIEQHPLPHLDLQIFTNLMCKKNRLENVVERVKKLLDSKHIRKFTVTASLDCWGAPQEYARFPLELEVWEDNFVYLLDHPWINLLVGSTITPLTIKTFPDLVAKIESWKKQRHVGHYFNSVNHPSYMYIDILGDVFSEDFNRALSLMPESINDQKNLKQYLAGIAKQSGSKGANKNETKKLKAFLDEMDRRRNTDWKKVFPWLPSLIDSILKD